jgi:hypothetical protein
MTPPFFWRYLVTSRREGLSAAQHLPAAHEEFQQVVKVALGLRAEIEAMAA